MTKRNSAKSVAASKSASPARKSVSPDEGLTAKFVKSAPAPDAGNRIYYDAKVGGFGLRVTAGGSKAFVLTYWTRSGRQRRYTIGQYPGLSVEAARKRAAELKDQIRVNGADPVGDNEDERGAKTIADLCERFESHLEKKRPATRRDYAATIERVVLPKWRHKKVGDISYSDVEDLHRKITKEGARGRGAPYQANRVLALLSKMFNLAIKLKWRTDNPTRGVERNNEAKRQRYLQSDELNALWAALRERDTAVRTAQKGKAERRGDQAADIVRLLLLTGARSGEVMSATWGQFDLKVGVWTKPSAHTKQKLEHRVPLSAPARKLLADIRGRLEEEPAEDEPVFPGRGSDAPQTTLKKAWNTIRGRATVLLWADADREGKLLAKLHKALGREPSLREVESAAQAAGLKLSVGLRDLRVHDLRHSYASLLAGEGMSLPMIGALLGHTQPATTARYSHLQDDPLRQATERAGNIISGARKNRPSAEIVPMKGGAA